MIESPREPSPSRRRLLKVAVVGFAGLQVAQLAAGPYRLWPFCAYDMFALREGPTHGALAVELVDDAGQRVLVAPGNVLPLEFFRAAAVIERVFVRGDEPGKQALAASILDSLARKPWSSFDEVWASARPTAGRHFVRLRLVRLTQSIELGPHGAALVNGRAERLYDYTLTTRGTSS
jgi:hypothetical protein